MGAVCCLSTLSKGEGKGGISSWTTFQAPLIGQRAGIILVVEVEKRKEEKRRGKGWGEKLRFLWEATRFGELHPGHVFDP